MEYSKKFQKFILIFSFFSLLCFSFKAHAYGIEIHRKLVSLALESSHKIKLNQYLKCPSQQDLNSFVIFLQNTLLQNTDDISKPELIESLDYYQSPPEHAVSMNVKQWLMLDPFAIVQGFDSFTCTSSISIQRLLEKGSVDPDLDLRNQNRIFYDRNGNPILDKNNQEIPVDPNILSMGNIHGLSSQAHAHYGLSLEPKSSDPQVLKETPHLFAMPPNVKTYSPEFAQIYLELALLAYQQHSPASELLSYYFLGNAFHYLGDVGNQIHTVQVGLYDFFFDAKLESYKDLLLSLGGFRYQPKDFKMIGIQILKNHHTLSEEWYAQLFLKHHPVIIKFLNSKKNQQQFKISSSKLLQNATVSSFGKNITYHLIEYSSKEGSEVYSLIRELAIPQLSKKEGIFDEAHDNPENFIQTEHDQKTEIRFLQVETLGLLRAATALSALFTFFEQNKNIAKTQDIIIPRIQSQNNYWKEVEQDRLKYFMEQNKVTDETFSLKKFIMTIMLIGFTIGWMIRGVFSSKPKRSIFH